MNMDQLRYFLSVARHRNFTEAARAFYVTQPAITHQISALERELGVKLFLRTTRSVTLTRAGELFLEDAKRMLDLEERAQKRMRQAEQTENLELKIGYLNSPCRHFLPQLMREYRSLYPQVRIDLIRGVAEDLQKGCEEMTFDLAFSVLSDLQGLNQYHCRRLVADFYCLVCPPDHSCLDNTSIDYSRLATEPFVCLSREGGSYMYKQFREICRDMGFTPRIVAEYPAMEDVLFAVQCGQALAILPYHIREYMYTDLAFLPLDGTSPVIEVGVAWRRQSENPAVSWFTDLIQRYLVEQPGLF